MAEYPLLERLDGIEARFEEVSTLITDPAVIADMKRYVRLSKEYKDLERLVSLTRKYRSLTENIEEAHMLLADESDAEMRQMAKEQLDAATDELPRLEEEIKLQLIPADPEDGKNAIIEIRGGTGGDEAALFAGDLCKMYIKYCESRGWAVAVTSASEGAAGGYKEVVLSVTGDGVYGVLKYESGVHRVQRVPETESQGRIHTSTATVAVLPEAEEFDAEVRDEDIRIDVFRSSGAGGQKVNKTETAIRITHFPTGIVVTCQNERSQLQNKEMAFKYLRAKLIERQIAEREAADAELKGEIKKIEWGSQIRSYVFCPYTLVKDHRTGYENTNVQAVMDGDIQGFIIDYLKKTI